MIDIMSLYNGSVLVIAGLVFLLGTVAVKSARSAVARSFIILSGLLVYAAIFVGPLQLLSYAKPVDLEWVNRNVEEAEVLHAELREGVGIYLLLDWYGEPRYYKIPWNAKQAQELIEAMEKAREEAGGEQRPGAMEPSEQGEPGGGEEQETLDRMFGPMGGETNEEKEKLENMEGGGEEGERGEMTNAGRGRVMMKNPFQAQEDKEGQDGEQREGSAGGEGPSGEYDDEASPAMFYPAPQAKYPEKAVPK